MLLGAPTEVSAGNLFNLTAYSPYFLGGVRIAMADVNGDGIPDIITAPGPTGGPDIRVFDGVTGKLIYEFYAYSPYFLGGVNLAAGDFTHDGYADIVTGAGPGGGPDTEFFGGTSLNHLDGFYAFNAYFQGGVFVGGS